MILTFIDFFFNLDDCIENAPHWIYSHLKQCYLFFQFCSISTSIKNKYCVNRCVFCFYSILVCGFLCALILSTQFICLHSVCDVLVVLHKGIYFLIIMLWMPCANSYVICSIVFRRVHWIQINESLRECNVQCTCLCLCLCLLMCVWMCVSISMLSSIQ